MFAGVNVDSVGDERNVSCETLNKGGSFDGPGVVFKKESYCAALAAAVATAADVTDDALFWLDISPPLAVTIS